MPFPSTSLSPLDDFNRANGGIQVGQANWINNGLIVGGNALNVAADRCAAAGASGNAYWNPTFSQRQEAYCTIPVLPAASGSVSLFVRCTGMSVANLSAYQLRWNVGMVDPTMELIVILDTVPATLAEFGSPGMEAGAEFMLRAFDNIIAAYAKPAGGEWFRVGDVADDQHLLPGRVGLVLSDTTARVDNFGGGAFVFGTHVLTALAGDRQVEQKEVYQGALERTTYSLDVSALGNNPADATVTITDLYTDADVTNSVMLIDEDEGVEDFVYTSSRIVLPPIFSLVEGHIYEVNIQFGIGSEFLSRWFLIQCNQTPVAGLLTALTWSPLD